MNAPDPADEELLERYGACLSCGAPRTARLYPLTNERGEPAAGMALVCSVDVNHFEPMGDAS